MDWIQIVLLSLIQGLTEFLPVSSSAHLVLPALLTDWPDQGLAFDVGVHFGTLMAVIVYFRQDLAKMSQAAIRFPISRTYTADLDLACKLALATLPIACIGFIGKDFIEENLRSVTVIAYATIVFGLLLWWADQRTPGVDKRGNPTAGDADYRDISWLIAMAIGFAQILALIPGTSRSGITITAALFFGLSRTSAARFSFLLAIPTIAGAQLLLMFDLLEQNASQAWVELAASSAIAGFAAFLCIHFFIQLVERTGMLPYVIYRLILGSVLLGIVYI